ncbi:MAG TPA: hypothetical protein VHI31_08825 [Actinomycetota bacterium]|nr:hypothetical protein [Actinomycetota bacterium]
MVQTAATIHTANLRSYLTDHLAGSAAGVGVAEKLAEQNEGNEFFQGLVKAIKDEQDTLERIMDKVGAEENPMKSAGAKVAGAIGTGLSGASASGSTGEMGSVRECEGLLMGITGKLALWNTLKEISGGDERLSAFNYDRLIQDAVSQRDGLEAERLKMSRKAFLR